MTGDCHFDCHLILVLVVLVLANSVANFSVSSTSNKCAPGPGTSGLAKAVPEKPMKTDIILILLSGVFFF